MKPFLFLLFLFSNSLYPVFSQSNLLESVKKIQTKLGIYVISLESLIQKVFQLVQIKP